MPIKSFLLAILISLAQGCSFFISLASSSDSSASSSESSHSIISNSSSSSSDDEQYQLDVMNYTLAYITSSVFDLFAFTRGISEIANQNGITNWEQDQATLTAIGRGLKNANISDSLFNLYKTSIANADINKMQMIQKGYDMQ